MLLKRDEKSMRRDGKVNRQSDSQSDRLVVREARVICLESDNQTG